ncbi:hypothetical protein FF124_01645 [Martelella lutilitoris]|uniref:Type I restriction modification DNA specificity domain-containing protein n=1 Tax=Martelella lutilitoris TaxID=2583532 RepID=A0A5C4JWT0_9HYPH|nr:restriction endonuclease subunit S [Martelella lutilitoris]TNB49690.1 hypothetical protein FF124_01645 [Martelella lutilitoris]
MSEHRAFPKSVQAGIPRLGPKPDGWTTYALGDLLEVVERPVRLDAEKHYQLVTAKRNRGGIVERGRLRGRSIKTKTQFLTKSGDFLISRRQIAHGACGIVPSSLDNAVVSNEYATLQPTDRLNIDFLKHLTNTIYFQQTCFHSSIGVHVEKLVFNLEHWMTWQFHLPPLPGQRRIAAILDEWDKAIAIAEKLVDTRARRKNWLSRQIFRLSGDQTSGGDIQEVKISDIAEVIRGVGYDPTIDKSPEGGVRILTAGNVQQRRITLQGDSTYVIEDIVPQRLLTQQDDFIVCMSNGSKHLVGKAGRCLNTPSEKMAAGAFCATVRPKHSQSVRLLDQMFQSQRYAELLHLALAGSAIGNLAPSQLEDFLFFFTDSEKSIEELELIDRDLDQSTLLAELLSSQKRGLMQKLLSGDLPVPESIDRLLPGGQDVDDALEAEDQSAEATG